MVPREAAGANLVEGKSVPVRRLGQGHPEVPGLGSAETERKLSYSF